MEDLANNLGCHFLALLLEIIRNENINKDLSSILLFKTILEV